MLVSRRSLLKAGAAGGALLLAAPAGAGTGRGPSLLGPSPLAASRTSRLAPGGALRVAVADLHNHTLLSDGNGNAADAFASMRSFGLDVAALTDHAGVGKGLGPACTGCAAAVGIDESEWQRIGMLADAADREGAFTAIRGFEWSSPTLGHMNVWFSQGWTDPAATAGIGAGTSVAALQHAGGSPLGPAATAQVDAALRALPDGPVSMAGFYDWLVASPTRPALGGGADSIAGFNHPGREGGRFGFFAYEPSLRDRVVSLEMFNRGEDYLFEGVDEGSVSPLTECLDAGWRVGLLGVSDEHGTNWGEPDGKGRTGVWVQELTRSGVRAGLTSRRFYATRERGLRVDATLDAVPMGGELTGRPATREFALDLDGGEAFEGRPVLVQVLQTGRPVPTVVHTEQAVLRGGDAPPIVFRAPVDAEAGWVVVRVTDPALPADGRAAGRPDYASAGRALAYASPWFLQP